MIKIAIFHFSIVGKFHHWQSLLLFVLSLLFVHDFHGFLYFRFSVERGTIENATRKDHNFRKGKTHRRCRQAKGIWFYWEQDWVRICSDFLWIRNERNEEFEFGFNLFILKIQIYNIIAWRKSKTCLQRCEATSRYEMEEERSSIQKNFQGNCFCRSCSKAIASTE